MKIELNIERIVLDGFELPSREAHKLRRALERELRLLFSDPRPMLASEGVAQVSAPPLQLSAANGGSAIGRELARSLHAAMPMRPRPQPSLLAQPSQPPQPPQPNPRSDRT